MEFVCYFEKFVKKKQRSVSRSRKAVGGSWEVTVFVASWCIFIKLVRNFSISHLLANRRAFFLICWPEGRPNGPAKDR